MSTELVVRDEYWERQQRILAELCGVDNEEIERIKIAIINVAESVAKYIQRIIDAFNKAIVVVSDVFANTFDTLCEKIKNLLDYVGISESDDYFTICDKFENYAVYVERKYGIQKEQYYKNCFKIAKMNYAIRNHDRRC